MSLINDNMPLSEFLIRDGTVRESSVARDPEDRGGQRRSDAMKRNTIKESGWLLAAAAVAAIAFAAIGASGCEDGMAPLDGDDGVSALAESGDRALANEEGVQNERRLARDGMGRKGKLDHRRHQRDRMDGMISTALEDLELSDEQRAEIEGLRVDGRDGKRGPRKGDARRGKGDFHAAFIEALETGSVDPAAFEPPEGRFDRADEFMAKRADRLNRLHEILTPDQRVALVAAVENRVESRGDLAKKRRFDRRGDFKDKRRFDRMGERGEPCDEDVREGRRPKRGMRGPGMLAWLEKDLELDAAQVEQLEELREKLDAKRPVRAKRSDRKAAMMEHRAAMLAAFAGDDFDAASFEPKDRPGFDKEAFVDNKVDMVEGLVEILTPEQRAELALKIKDRGGKFGPRR